MDTWDLQNQSWHNFRRKKKINSIHCADGAPPVEYLQSLLGWCESCQQVWRELLNFMDNILIAPETWEDGMKSHEKAQAGRLDTLT